VDKIAGTKEDIDKFKETLKKWGEICTHGGTGKGNVFNIQYMNALKDLEREKYSGYSSPGNLRSGYQSIRNTFNKRRRQLQLQRNTNKARYNRVKTGNLLGLNKVGLKKEEPDLMSFEPTKAGLKSRQNELAGLYGGKRRTQRRRKV